IAQRELDQPMKPTKNEQALSVVDILAEPKAPDVPTRSVREVAGVLLDRALSVLRKFGITEKITGPGRRTDRMLARVIALKIRAALGRDGHAGAWYTGQVRDAMNVAATMHPELATDANARSAYTVALAITSQGEAVPSNVRLADIAYTRFKEDGRFPTDFK